MKKIRLSSLISAAGLMFGAIASLTACGKKGSPYEYEAWISAGETAYNDYNDNVAVKYWNTLKFKGADDEEHDTKIKFYVGTGDSRTQFNTMISGQNYYDIMDLGMSDYAASELYSNGMLLDLTPYMEECMPNYLAWLNRPENETYAKTAVDYVNGEKKYLQIYSYHDVVENWGGLQYRRDWIVKYGTKPGTSMSYVKGTKAEFDAGNADYYYDEHGYLVDNIIFPSYNNESLRNSYNALLETKGLRQWDGHDPVFISDWEWMFEIFAKAISALNIGKSDGYVFGIYNPGYIETGDIISGFGGGSAGFYSDNGTVKYGLTSPNFKAYLDCMNSWYNKGWLDKDFDAKKSDVFYQVDVQNTYSGRVGLFYGNGNTIHNKRAISGDNIRDGMYVAGARQPINDIYGSGEEGGQKYVVGTNEFLPDTYYAASKEYNSVGLTTKLTKNGKDVKALLRMIDHLFEKDGGALLCSGGLTKAQYDTVAQSGDMYAKTVINGKSLAETGSYVKRDDGTFALIDVIGVKDDERNYSKINRFTGYFQDVDYGRLPAEQHLIDEWSFYPSEGRFLSSFEHQLDAKASKKYNDTNVSVRDYAAIEIPKLIKGGNGINQSSYDSVMKQVKRYNIAEVITSLQTLYDKFYK